MKWQQKHSSLTIIIVGFAVLYLLFHKTWLLLPAIVALFGFMIPRLGKAIHQGWMKLAMIMGWINGRILLTIIFFLLLTPLAFLARLFSKSAFYKLGDRKTGFIQRQHRYQKEDFDQLW
jgi:hypothetical protein